MVKSSWDSKRWLYLQGVISYGLEPSAAIYPHSD